MNHIQEDVYEFISKQSKDPILSRKTCRFSGTIFPIYQSDQDFYKMISPKIGGKVFDIPTPTLCPEERKKRRLSFRNERSLYKRKCDATGETIISMYSPDKSYTVYDQTVWWSDNRDPLFYGKEYVFGSVLEHIKSIYDIVPKSSLINDNSSENSLYVNQTTHQKNCYLVFDSDYCENCMYSSVVKNTKNCIDCINTHESEVCFENNNCTQNTITFYCTESVSCSMSYFLTRCVGCSFCFGCINLVNKSYCIFNKQYSKEEYESMIGGLLDQYLGDAVKVQDALKKQMKTTPQRAVYTVQTNDVFGNNLVKTKNTILSTDMVNTNNMKYCSLLSDSSNCYDYDVRGDNCEYCYECETVGENSSRMLFCRGCWAGCSECYYCIDCIGIKNCFGCVGLRNKSYCIFNVQYSKEEYENMLADIIAKMQKNNEWGEFFSTSMSPFGYNETVANEYFPMGKGDVESAGRTWQSENFDPQIPSGVETLEGAEINEYKDISGDSLLKKIILCRETGRPFRIIKTELDFYRKYGLLFPSEHPDVRHKRRFDAKPGVKLYMRKCDKTGEDIISVYPPEYTSPVWSERAYNKEIFN